MCLQLRGIQMTHKCSFTYMDCYKLACVHLYMHTHELKSRHTCVDTFIYMHISSRKTFLAASGLAINTLLLIMRESLDNALIKFHSNFL